MSLTKDIWKKGATIIVAAFAASCSGSPQEKTPKEIELLRTNTPSIHECMKRASQEDCVAAHPDRVAIECTTKAVSTEETELSIGVPMGGSGLAISLDGQLHIDLGSGLISVPHATTKNVLSCG